MGENKSDRNTGLSCLACFGKALLYSGYSEDFDPEYDDLGGFDSSDYDPAYGPKYEILEKL